MSKIYQYILAAGIFISLLGAAYWWHGNKVDAFKLQVQIEMADQYNDRLVALQNKADAAGILLTDKLKEIEDAKKVEIAGINSRHATALARLSDRPNRPTSGTNNDSNTGTKAGQTGATGLQLSGPDGSFLVWFSRDTAELQAELKSCRFDYAAVKKQFEDFVNANPRFVTTPNP